MSETLENEDLDNGPLVRMEDVQPARVSGISLSIDNSDPLDTYTVDHLDYENECVVDDEDSNVGSMVSIKSEEALGYDDDDESDSEQADPDQDEPYEEPLIDEDIKPTVVLPSQPESWPTLEILPGGVIKHAEKCESDLSTIYGNVESDGDASDQMYACAKCSQSFKYLFCLVKHVRWHEKEAAKQKEPDKKQLTSLEKQLIFVKRARLDLEKGYKKQKVEVLTRIASALASIDNIEDKINKL